MGKESARFFSTTEKEAIEQAIRRVESGTAGEIVVMVVDTSDDYREAVVAGAAVFAAFAAFVLSLGLHHETIWFYIPAMFAFFIPGYFLFRTLPRLRMPLVGRGRSAAAVRERALRAFFEKGLHRTRDESGILIFLSLLERKVWILGDRGIDARIDPGGWKKYADRIVGGIHEGKTAEVLCAVVEEWGGILRDAFPPRDNDANELPNHVIT